MSPRTPESLLLELLARIHRDGGQYAEAVGLDLASAEADAIVAKAFAEREELRAAMAVMASVLESAVGILREELERVER